MTKRLLLVCLCLVMSACSTTSVSGPDSGGMWAIGGNGLDVKFNEKDATFAVTDSASGVTWKQAAAKDVFAVKSVKKSGAKLSIELSGAVEMTALAAITKDGGFELTLTPKDPRAKIEKLSYPGPFVTPSDDYNIVLADAEGLLVPVKDNFSGDDKEYQIWGMNGIIMPWSGMTDGNLKKGYMMIVETADDAGIRVAKRDMKLASLEPIWLPSMQTISYPRKVVYYFFKDGGYVAQAKKYREYVKANGEFRTLREKQKTVPQIAELIGAVHVYLWDQARSVDFVKGMKAAGINKAWIGWDPDHPPYPKKGFDEGVKAVGYLAGVYDLYRDMYDDKEYEKAMKTDPVLKELVFHRYYFPGAFPKITPKNSKGELMSVKMGTDTGLMRYWVCTKVVHPFLYDRMKRELAIYPHDSTFIDVTCAAQLIECYDENHRMTRTEDKEARLKIHKIFANEYKFVVGSEFGSDFGVPYTDFQHGLMTLHHYWDLRGPTEGATGLGDWSNTQRPTMMLMEVKPTEKYKQIGVGEYHRIPLYDLVYHDSTVSSWRWNENSHKMPEVWEQKDLLNILYANAPQYNLDQENWAKQKDKFVASYKKVAPVIEKLGYDEMTDHKWLTPDRTVQQTSFSSGTKVVVNFSTKPFTLDGKTVPARGYVMLEK